MITSIEINFSNLAAEALELIRCGNTPLARPRRKHDPYSGSRISVRDR
jgi:hypothetical protein